MSTYINESNNKTFDISSLDAPRFLKNYLNYQSAIKNLTQRSVDNYYVQLRTFLGWAHLRYNESGSITREKIQDTDITKMPLAEITDLTNIEIIEFISFCSNQLGNEDAAKRLKLAAIRSLYDFLIDNNQMSGKENPARKVETPKSANEKGLPTFLEQEQCEKLLVTVATNEKCTNREECMITLFLNCGMRVQELVNINVADISNDGVVLKEDCSLILRGKGRKERTVYLNKACQDVMYRYLHERAEILYEMENRDEKKTHKKRVPDATKETALFVSNRTGKRLTTRRVQQIVENSLINAGFRTKEENPLGLSTHKLRHTAATLAYQSGADIYKLQQLLGHESSSTTEIYTHVKTEAIKELLDNSPLATFDPNNPKGGNDN